MAKQSNKPENIFLYVGLLRDVIYEKIFQYNLTAKHPYKIACLCDYNDAQLPSGVIRINTDFSNPASIKNSLKPYLKQIIGVTTRGEHRIPLLQATIPFLPKEIRVPSIKSLTNTTSKIQMRRSLLAHNSKISPKFTVAKDSSKKTILKISKQIGFPAIIKPSGLASSLLISSCYDKIELEEQLISVFKKLKSVYKKNSGRGIPEILVEEMMEGLMYSTDAYVDNVGKATCLPLINSRSGRTIGFQDFFEYITSIPVTLPSKVTEDAFFVAQEAVTATGLTNSTAHIEMILTEQGWKIVELGPRIGGFRDVLYELSYGIKHTMNEIFSHTNKKPIIKRKILAHSVLMQFYPEKEGLIKRMEGIRKIKKLKSYHSIHVKKDYGEKALYAINGGTPVIQLYLSHKSQQQLSKDIRRVETSIKIVTN